MSRIKLEAEQAKPAAMKEDADTRAVWMGDSVQMMKQFEQRLNILADLSDLDKNGFIDRDEFIKLSVDLVRCQMELQVAILIVFKNLRQICSDETLPIYHR